MGTNTRSYLFGTAHGGYPIPPIGIKPCSTTMCVAAGISFINLTTPRLMRTRKMVGPVPGVRSSKRSNRVTTTLTKWVCSQHNLSVPIEDGQLGHLGLARADQLKFAHGQCWFPADVSRSKLWVRGQQLSATRRRRVHHHHHHHLRLVGGELRTGKLRLRRLLISALRLRLRVRRLSEERHEIRAFIKERIEMYAESNPDRS